MLISMRTHAHLATLSIQHNMRYELLRYVHAYGDKYVIEFSQSNVEILVVSLHL